MNISPDLLSDFYQITRFSPSDTDSCNILYRSRDILSHLKRHNHSSDVAYVKHYKPDLDHILDFYALYLVAREHLPAFKKSLGKSKHDMQYIILLEEGYDINQVFPLRKQDDYVILSCRKTISESIEDLLERSLKLLSWDSFFTHGLLHEHKTELLLKSLDIVLPWDYIFSDVDGNVIFASDSFNQTSTIIEGGRISSELTQDMFSRKEFHELIKEQDLFYYYIHFTDTTNLCQNLFINGRFMARLVMPLPEGMSRCSPGIEELFRFCIIKLKDLLINRNLLPTKHTNDHMHQMCRSILEGGTIQQDRMTEILNEYKWSQYDTYSLSVLHFESAPGWNTNLHMIYSFLMLEIEKNWYNACALNVNNKILLIFNHTRDTLSDQYDDYLQRIAYFVRDNLCKAGIAPLFQDFTALPQAKKAAEIALEIGMKRKPHHWYYLYEDFRLPYLLQRMKDAGEEDLLCNPRIRTLMEYDMEHEGELTNTLKTFLECNMNMTNAAKKLFIHRTSFCRRMNHISELTGLDYNDPDVVLDLLLSYRIMEDN